MATRGITTISGSPPATVRPSRVIQALAALTAIYLSMALYYGVSEAARIADFALIAAFVVAVAFVAAAAQVNWRFGAVLALALSFVAQLAWAGWAEPAPIGELESLWLQARRIAASLRAGAFDPLLIFDSPSPSATMTYAFAILVFGEDLAVLRVLSAALWTAQAWLVWRICDEVSELRPRGFAAVLLFGLAPSVVVFGALPSVEAVFGFFALFSVYLVLSHRRRGLGLSAFLSGVLGALAFLAHPSGIGYVAGLIAVLLVGLTWERRWPGRWRMSLAVFACILGFGIGVAPQAALNKIVEGRFSIAPGPAIGLELLFGTNRASDGAYSGDEIQRVGFDTASGVALRAADLQARRIAFERISADPQGFIIFAATTKMQKVWGSERQVLGPSVNAPLRTPREFEESFVGSVAPSLVDGVYLGILTLATFGALRLTLRGGAVRDPTRWVLVFIAILSLAFAQAFLQARPLAHLAFTPLLVLLTPMAVSRLPRVLSARGEMREREEAQKVREEETDKAFDLASIHKPKPVDPEVAKQSAEARLAIVLKGMSKPPRPADEEGEGPDIEGRGDAKSGDAKDGAPEQPGSMRVRKGRDISA